MSIVAKELCTSKRPGKAPVLRILFVEDNIDCAESTALLITLNGHDAAISHNGQEALEVAETYKPDVVLLDIGLPGMDGYQVARQFSQQRPEKSPLLVAVTGYGQEADRLHSTDAGFGLHLIKPVDPVQLLALLQRFCTLIDPSR